MEHTVRAVDAELKGLSGDVVALGELAVAQVRASVDAFLRHDAAAATEIAAADVRLDALDADIEGRAVRFIALRQPMADDLRRPIVAMKTAMQLERCGDLAKNIAKRVGRMDGAAAKAPAETIAKLGALVADRLAEVVSAYGGDDAAGAHRVWEKDTDVDALHEAAMREVMTCMTSNPASLSDCTHLLFIAKNLERIGDHATNVAELVHYQLTGDDLTDRPKL